MIVGAYRVVRVDEVVMLAVTCGIASTSGLPNGLASSLVRSVFYYPNNEVAVDDLRDNVQVIQVIRTSYRRYNRIEVRPCFAYALPPSLRDLFLRPRRVYVARGRRIVLSPNVLTTLIRLVFRGTNTIAILHFYREDCLFNCSDLYYEISNVDVDGGLYSLHVVSQASGPAPLLNVIHSFTLVTKAAGIYIYVSISVFEANTRTIPQGLGGAPDLLREVDRNRYSRARLIQGQTI